jgi:hypothetical protein
MSIDSVNVLQTRSVKTSMTDRFSAFKSLGIEVEQILTREIDTASCGLYGSDFSSLENRISSGSLCCKWLRRRPLYRGERPNSKKFRFCGTDRRFECTSLAMQADRSGARIAVPLFWCKKLKNDFYCYFFLKEPSLPESNLELDALAPFPFFLLSMLA